MTPQNVFAGAHLDRSHRLRREEAALALARRSPAARVVPYWRARNLVSRGEPAAVTLPLSRLEPEVERAEEEGTLVLLGVEEQTPYFALDLSPLSEDAVAELLSEHGELVDLRGVGAVLSRPDAALLAYVRAILTWHGRSRFCGACGAATRSSQGGHVRTCSQCGADEFPRSDPAVIMLAHTEDDHCLLGRQSSWPEGVFSTLAGFVEPGESLEDAVRREVHEETGVRVLEATYHSSQPWPFPSSIMLGFLALAEHDPIEVDPEEIEEAHWFAREELLERKAKRQIRFPPRMSVARQLIEAWLAR